MMEPEFASAFRLAELIDAARNPMMSIGGAMPDEAIIAVLEAPSRLYGTGCRSHTDPVDENARRLDLW
jgi:hypothetical protein